MKKRTGRFITPEAVGFFDSIVREITDIGGNFVIWYPIDNMQSSASNKASIYREQPFKTVNRAVQIPCSVEYRDRDIQNKNNAYYEYESDIVVYFHKQILKEKDVTIREDDILTFGDSFFEVFNIDDSKRYHNSPFHVHTITVFANTKRLDSSLKNLISDIEIDQYYSKRS